MRKEIIVFKGNKGVVFKRYNMKTISKVVILNKKSFLRAYKFNNTHGVEFHSPYISWENLNCCGIWIHDTKYLNTAVQKGKKVCAGIEFDDYDKVGKYIEKIDEDKYVYSIKEFYKGPSLFYRLDIARKGRLSDYFELEEIIKFYDLLGLNINLKDEDRFMELFNTDIFELINGNKGLDYESKTKTMAEDVITGLLLGYPLESTIAYISGREDRDVYK